MRILVVAQDFPWPPTYGSRLRLVQLLEEAVSLGETDLFSFVTGAPGEQYEVPDGLAITRVETAVSRLQRYTPARRLQFLASRLPLEAIALTSPGAAERFSSWARPEYDVVWFSKAMTYFRLGRPKLGPTIVDLDDLEDRKIVARLTAMRNDRERGGLVNYLGATTQARLNARRWRSFQNATAACADRVVLCSELDVDRFGTGNAVIVPNGFEAPAVPAGRVQVGDPPVLLLQGSLGYGPNSDAARWLVTTIAPRIRTELPQVRVRLVGDPDGTVVNLDDPPAVTVVGRVPEMDPELRLADIVCVPLRYGSGTRVKILEAFANRIPVVSTSIGAEGLGVEHGRHLLVADDPESFAAACLRLLTEPDLRKQLADSAEHEFLERHQWTVARERIRRLFSELARPSAR